MCVHATTCVEGVWVAELIVNVCEFARGHHAEQLHTCATRLCPCICVVCLSWGGVMRQQVVGMSSLRYVRHVAVDLLVMMRIGQLCVRWIFVECVWPRGRCVVKCLSNSLRSCWFEACKH